MSDIFEVKADTVKPGDVLIADGGFVSYEQDFWSWLRRTFLRRGTRELCIREGTQVTVKADDAGELYVPCVHGRHYLEGQSSFDDRGMYIGLKRKAV